jgi:quercetin dioxygenase-like cupin family protein
MQFRTTELLLLGAMALPASGTAQTTPAPPAITRTVVAAAKLPTVTDVPLHFKAVSVTLQPDEKSGISAANGILYQMSGSTEVALDGEAKMLNAGEGLFIAGGKTAALTAGSGGPSTFLHFLLVPAVDLGRPVEKAPAAVRELYRTEASIPDLKPGGYDLNLLQSLFEWAQQRRAPDAERSFASAKLSSAKLGKLPEDAGDAFSSPATRWRILTTATGARRESSSTTVGVSVGCA